MIFYFLLFIFVGTIVLETLLIVAAEIIRMIFKGDDECDT